MTSPLTPEELDEHIKGKTFHDFHIGPRLIATIRAAWEEIGTLSNQRGFISQESYNRGVADERKRVVEWLKRGEWLPGAVVEHPIVIWLIDCFGRGEHEKGGGG